MRPVLIMMVWNPCRSIAHSLMSVRAADKRRQTGRLKSNRVIAQQLDRSDCDSEMSLIRFANLEKKAFSVSFRVASDFAANPPPFNCDE